MIELADCCKPDGRRLLSGSNQLGEARGWYSCMVCLTIHSRARRTFMALQSEQGLRLLPLLKFKNVTESVPTRSEALLQLIHGGTALTEQKRESRFLIDV
jgi:hypothetical protein